MLHHVLTTDAVRRRMRVAVALLTLALGGVFGGVLIRDAEGATARTASARVTLAVAGQPHALVASGQIRAVRNAPQRWRVALEQRTQHRGRTVWRERVRKSVRAHRRATAFSLRWRTAPHHR